MVEKMGSIKPYQPIQVEVEEIQKEVVKKGGIVSQEVGATYYFVENEERL